MNIDETTDHEDLLKIMKPRRRRSRPPEVEGIEETTSTPEAKPAAKPAAKPEPKAEK